MPTPRQTLSHLRRLLRAHGIRPLAKRGQNFLIDLNLVGVLIEAAEVGRGDLVLEVGAGTGGLTGELAARGGHVVAVEVDSQLFEVAREAVAGCSNVTLLRADILAGKNRLNPEVMDVLRARWGQGRSGFRVQGSGEDANAAPEARTLSPEPSLGPRPSSLKLVANLPYVVATPVISNLLATDLPWASMTVTVQQELADRLAARPGTKDYGALSIWVQAQAEVHVLRRLPPSVFWPKPQVSSAIVQIVPRAELAARLHHREAFHGFVRGVFLHRRKHLRGVLAKMCAERAKEDVDRVLAEEGLPLDVRAEQLSVEQFLSLSRRLGGGATPPTA